MRVRALITAAGLAAAGLFLIAHPALAPTPGHDASADAVAPTAAPADGVTTMSLNDSAWD